MHGKFLDQQDTDMKPVRKCLKDKRGKFAFISVTQVKNAVAPSKLAAKLASERLAKREFSRLERGGHLHVISLEKFEEYAVKLASQEMKSNDKHIIVLALAAEAKILIANDHALEEDFKDQITGGRIYKDKGHDQLLYPRIKGKHKRT